MARVKMLRADLRRIGEKYVDAMRGKLPLDFLLAISTLYWLTDTYPSSVYPYRYVSLFTFIDIQNSLFPMGFAVIRVPAQNPLQPRPHRCFNALEGAETELTSVYGSTTQRSYRLGRVVSQTPWILSFQIRDCANTPSLGRKDWKSRLVEKAR